MALRGDAPWSVSATATVERDLDELEDTVRAAALDIFADLEEDPFPPGSSLLRGYINLYRVKFYRAAYRLLYTVSEKQHRVIVERVRPRSTAYLGLRDPHR